MNIPATAKLYDYFESNIDDIEFIYRLDDVFVLISKAKSQSLLSNPDQIFTSGFIASDLTNKNHWQKIFLDNLAALVNAGKEFAYVETGYDNKYLKFNVLNRYFIIKVNLILNRHITAISI